MCIAFFANSLPYHPSRKPKRLLCRNLEGAHTSSAPQVEMVLEVHKMKVSNRPSVNVLAALVSAAVLIGSSVGVAHAEDGPCEAWADVHDVRQIPAHQPTLNHCVPSWLRIQVICRLAYCRLAVAASVLASASDVRPAR